jgi:hypothetical protein
MRAPGGRGWIGLAAGALACAGPLVHGVEPCLLPEQRAPLPAADCLHGPEGQRYAQLVASAIGWSLGGWSRRAGAAELSVRFAEDASVRSVCHASSWGDSVQRRIRYAADLVRRLPPAPACLAGRRLDFAWESPVVTDEELRAAERECRRRIAPLRREIDFCYLRQDCPREQVLGLWARADDELRSCVLEKVPLAIAGAGSAQSLRFVPREGTRPDPQLAIRASRVCSRLLDRAALVDCVREHGFEPLEASSEGSSSLASPGRSVPASPQAR